MQPGAKTRNEQSAAREIAQIDAALNARAEARRGGQMHRDTPVWGMDPLASTTLADAVILNDTPETAVPQVQLPGLP